MLSCYADVIAEKTGLGRAWVEVILLAGVTVLPELVSGATVVTVLNAPNLPSGGIAGSILSQREFIFCCYNFRRASCFNVPRRTGCCMKEAQTEQKV